ncbi:hypothetical protein LI328DRAFT_159262 [Trichoderma asperelloides]|nr:hypothetical protein LI328DRAFT_159262 [Trichoderma asperelloides]
MSPVASRGGIAVQSLARGIGSAGEAILYAGDDQQPQLMHPAAQCTAGRAWTWNPLTAFHFLEYRASYCRLHSNRPLLTLFCSRCSGALLTSLPFLCPIESLPLTGATGCWRRLIPDGMGRLWCQERFRISRPRFSFASSGVTACDWPDGCRRPTPCVRLCEEQLPWAVEPKREDGHWWALE